jgi:hypothetical protein
MSSVRRAVESAFGDLKNLPRSLPSLESNLDYGYGAIQDWCSLHRGVNAVWGIHFERNYWSDEIEPRPERDDAAFVYIEFKNLFPRPKGSQFLDWHFPPATAIDDFEVAKIVDLAKFSDEPTARFSSWVVEALREAKEIIELSFHVSPGKR